MVFMGFQATLCSDTVLIVNIHINMHNLQIMLHIQTNSVLLFMQDIADRCIVHRIRNSMQARERFVSIK